MKADAFRWHCSTLLEKYWNRGDRLELYDVVFVDGNMLLFGGASALWNRLLNSSPSVGVFNNANTYIGVGDSATAAAATQTDLQGTNKFRKVMNPTYPTHTDGTGGSNGTALFQASFGTADANFAWREWGIFNASTAGRMLNRKVQAFGTKPAGATWTLTITLSIT